MASETEKTRFRSFAERYLISRATFFRVGNETEDAHTCLLDARRIYTMTKGMANTLRVDD